MPTFNAPRKVEIILYDDAGGRRIAVAERTRGYASQPHWRMALTHDTTGRSWPADFNGNAIIDALGSLVEQKEIEYHTRSGYAKHDRVVSVRDDGTMSGANITKRQGFGRAAAAAARARTGGED
jgi:hypothetical protein